MHALTRLQHITSSKIASRPVGVLRTILGAATLIRAIEAWQILTHVLRPGAFRLPYVEWVPQLPPAGLVPLLATWAISGLLFMVGWQVRLAGSVLAGTMLYVLLLDQQTYSNHLYFFVMAVVLLTMAQSGSALSYQHPSCNAFIPYWPILLLKWQVSILYTFAALSKLNPQFLSGEVLEHYAHRSVVSLVPSNHQKALFQGASIVSIALELFIPVALWFRAWRVVATVIGVLLHFGMVTLLAPHNATQLQVFALVSLSLYTLFYLEPKRY